MPKPQEPETAGNIACEIRKQGVMRVCVQLQFSVLYDPELMGTAHFHVAIHTSSNLIHFFFFFGRISLCTPGICYVDQDGLQLIDIKVPLPPKYWD